MADVTPLIEAFSSFFEEHYISKIEKLASDYPLKKSLEVDYTILEKFSPELADKLLESPDEVIEAASEALSSMGSTLPLLPDTKFEPHVRFSKIPNTGLLIQDVGSAHLQKLVYLEGVVTKRTEVWPQVKIAFYQCSHCDADYKVPFMRKKPALLSVCQECKRPVKLNEDESYFVDFQRAEMQELLERLDKNAPASRVELDLEDDLVNKLIPGELMGICGIVRIRPPLAKSRLSSGTYVKYVDVINIESLNRDFEEVEISKEEEKKLVELSKDPEVFEKITHSLAPSIYGHTEVKQAITLQLFGGTPDKELPGGGRIRSDIHILLIGDPGSAKTRFLQYVDMLAPKSIYVSGKSVSGVGLTASAEKDELGEGGWVLKAGALVLASGGLACVDEFDKIDDNERGALHEVMESGTVSVAKAGIVARFKARTSIIAAANPKFGRFDPNKYPADQFDIPPTLLSRFDLIFPIKDTLDKERDRKLADYILENHTAAGMRDTTKLSEARTPISRDFLRKFIAYARKMTRPVLTPEASAKIKDYYVELRNAGQQGSVAITPRQIEGLIRLSEASAKSRLSDKVEAIDAERAIKLNTFVMQAIALDKATGKFDIDIWQTGQPKSKTDQYVAIMDIVERLQKEFDLVEISDVVKRAKEERNIEEAVTRQFIDDRVDKGEFYKPKHGFIKLVRRMG